MPSSRPSVTTNINGPFLNPFQDEMLQRMQNYRYTMRTAGPTPVNVNRVRTGTVSADIDGLNIWYDEAPDGHVGVTVHSNADGTLSPAETKSFAWSEDDRIQATVMAIRDKLMRYFKDIKLDKVASAQLTLHTADNFQLRQHDGRVFNWEREIAANAQRKVLYFNSAFPLFMVCKSPMEIVFLDSVGKVDERLQRIQDQVQAFMERFLPAVTVKHQAEGCPEGYDFFLGTASTAEAITEALQGSQPVLRPQTDTLEELRSRLADEMQF